VLWQILKDLSRAAGARKKPLSICGEMASRKGMPGRLLDIGIQTLSVSPRLVPRVREEAVDYFSGGAPSTDREAVSAPNK
jgi:phosphoenolpyruvate-protein kinase (PTS system EI component)